MTWTAPRRQTGRVLFEMQVTSNIVRFPYATNPVTPARPQAKEPDSDDNIVSFTPPLNPSVVSGYDAGLMFAAHRIVSRVAEGLDGTPVL